MSSIESELQLLNSSRSKYPWTNNEHYVGVELEFISIHPVDTIKMVFAKAGLGKYIGIGNDSSIQLENGYSHAMEVRVIAPETEIRRIMRKTLACLEAAKCKVNVSCGLHVHIDVRNRTDKKRILSNFVNMQGLLFSLGNDSRFNSRFCRPVDTSTITRYDTQSGFPTDIFDLTDDHHSAINSQHMSSNSPKQTIEIRIHRGTLDYEIVSRWIKLLMKIANYTKKLDDNLTKTVLAKKLKLNDDMREYIFNKGKVNV